jgi:hypothetical protein
MTTHNARQQGTSLRWLYIISMFLVLPAAFLLLPGSMAESLLFGWLITTGFYVIILSALAITNRPVKKEQGKVVKAMTRLLAIVVWSGFLAVAYYFLYYIIFDRENLFPR